MRDRAGRALLSAALARLEHGRITVCDGPRRLAGGRPTTAFPVEAEIRVNSPRFYGSLLRGSTGAGLSYAAGDWDADDLTALLRVCARNLHGLDRRRRKAAPVARPAKAAAAWIGRNTRSRSRRQIAAHYDLGDDFFELFLDPTMTYSCAVFEGEDMDLEEAQRAKVDRICRKLDLGPGDHLLEVGTGWGHLAMHAAATYGCRVTTTTISRAQHATAVRRVREAGLEGRVEVLLSDYRDLRGTYDKLVSVEMIEAVGWQCLDTFFAACGRLLRPDGLMCLQAITIRDQVYEDSKLSRDFINTQIFPGGCLTSVKAISESLGRATQLRFVHLEEIGGHYARTLAEWRRNLHRNLDAIREAGYGDPAFLRRWELYLCMCEAGFRERRIGDVQALIAGPAFRGETLWPLEGGVRAPADLTAPARG